MRHEAGGGARHRGDAGAGRQGGAGGQGGSQVDRSSINSSYNNTLVHQEAVTVRLWPSESISLISVLLSQYLDEPKPVKWILRCVNLHTFCRIQCIFINNVLYSEVILLACRLIQN